jgi:hypothetical protein
VTVDSDGAVLDEKIVGLTHWFVSFIDIPKVDTVEERNGNSVTATEDIMAPLPMVLAMGGKKRSPAPTTTTSGSPSDAAEPFDLHRIISRSHLEPVPPFRSRQAVCLYVWPASYLISFSWSMMLRSPNY